MRILPSKKSREKIFNQLMKKHGVRNLKELAQKLNIPYKTIKNWRYDFEKYIPHFLTENSLLKLKIIDTKPDNWGQIKGGKRGIEKKIKNLKKLWKDPKYYNQRKEMGKRAIERMREMYGDNLIKKIIEGKIKKRERTSKRLEEENEFFFSNKIIELNSNDIKFSKRDQEKNIQFPTEMSIQLAEEIGIHLGDGCLSYNRNYFSVKCNKKEEKYITEFIFPLHKKLYNIDLKLMQLPSVSGFEIYSKALFEFKNKVLGIPYGEKKEKIEIPQLLLKTKNKEIYRAVIRGLFDTDGCIHIVKRKNYPVISITIKSKKLIEQLAEMLKKLGFIPTIYKWTISLNGSVMLNKWIKEINSSNPVKIAKLEQASRIVDSTQPCGQ